LASDLFFYSSSRVPAVAWVVVDVVGASGGLTSWELVTVPMPLDSLGPASSTMKTDMDKNMYTNMETDMEMDTDMDIDMDRDTTIVLSMIKCNGIMLPLCY
jgi:hypothetical protein